MPHQNPRTVDETLFTRKIFSSFAVKEFFSNRNITNQSGALNLIVVGIVFVVRVLQVGHREAKNGSDAGELRKLWKRKKIY